jgi:hypothetical protein
MVKTLVDQAQGLGGHQLTMDGSELEPGIYLYEIQAGTGVHRGKIIRMK